MILEESILWRLMQMLRNETEPCMQCMEFDDVMLRENAGEGAAEA
jgi:hypothetical protein